MSDEVIETAKAVQEVAKTSSKALDIGREVGNFIVRYTGGSLAEAIGIFEDKLKYARWENQIKLIQKAKKFLKKQGLETPNKPIPFKLAIPLLHAASLEDDDYLQTMWAKLLVNAATKNNNFELKRVYIDILERITAFEAKILEKIYSLPYEETAHSRIMTYKLPNYVEILEKTKDLKDYPDPNDEVKLGLLNLDRLNCLSVAVSMGGGQIFKIVNQTLLGKNFINACTINDE